jgi:2,5-dihydroxypyridine 5,6-dioxygenase
MQTALMARGASKLVGVCARVKPGEQVLIITDFMMDQRMTEALASATVAAGAHPTIVLMSQVKTDSGEPNAAVATAMQNTDVIFTPVSVSITHSKSVEDACAAGARIVALTQFTPELMMGGGIEADFDALAVDCRAVAKVLDAGSSMTVTTPAGTDLILDISGRAGIAKTCLVEPGEFSPAPDIEATVSPISGEGVVVCDASIPYLGIGVPDRPVTVTVKGGKVVSIEGGRAADIVREAWESMSDPNVYNVAELGIGLNPHCRLLGIMLEDEGVYGTCHMGTGTSTTLGGTVQASCHYDFVMHEPTIRVDGQILVDGGTPLIPR